MFNEDIELAPTRNGYGKGLVLAGEKDERVVALCADLTESTRTDAFAKKFPDRFIEVGVAEQAMATIASGMANYGKIPFIASYAAFSPGRNWEQIRTTIALNDLPVKIAGHHAGISVGPDGATHQMLEDIALMRAMPNMIVVVPADSVEGRKATIAAAGNGKPTYLRFAREKTPVFTTDKTLFKIGEALTLWESETPQAAIIGAGPLLYEALLAARELEKSHIGSVILNCHTVSPIDERAIVSVARKCGAVVTLEEHQINGGLGSAVAEVLARNWPVPIEFVGMPNSFGESGQPDELLEKYKMKAEHIVEAVKKVIKRKTDRE
ncbi:MAG: transketolase [Candidatus Blackburnbacteria bacterium RIFCSPHIGHO2_01_FULL_44_64]|uniref:Transketolase n=1 Tax=Candidatus Blackburnbacteria bacterium RIFCSPHIGHO2_02_FULL_44_20 TaxID=1797516 RepID=A0A1G1V8E2_9BACT|nr:MAG: transketolase [Candidatus Blackburnbacteria bacterium RIFCSPHIGHO2_01_FULL_44_64]OGY11593.1 MAG: transketolase [Candidatus Blackburnbacteria bacterium RIFCSPHIGHO2_12_FULL_44_25]OGY11690.1 MAG: transketolase [Candidatus Blackburnbacteria bacterium RIFCSPHIGHO2_02_FULL_44_20]OGY13974.1 MAG: transketolase [Candidatus Blackburnbacteria bacterium RIFCSPLOWO2_01_FULL_44_43]OGY17413.1 MAG: transketolase [Candidatus Blackburnbacteria bacterium RIFCSPLOWO2_02_FULL_44_9]